MTSELAGLATGLCCGLALARGIAAPKPTNRELGIAGAAAAFVVLVSAFAVGGIADVRPEIDRVVALEERTSTTYRDAANQQKRGRMSAEALAQLIDRTIMPELQAAQQHLEALDGVPQEHQEIVTTAQEYLRLRYESWRLRAQGLRGANSSVREAGKTAGGLEPNSRIRAETQYRATMMTLGRAEGTERASLKALEKIKPTTEP
jgi:hypothetical protein